MIVYFLLLLCLALGLAITQGYSIDWQFVRVGVIVLTLSIGIGAMLGVMM